MLLRQVVGDSMLPVLRDGKLVVALKRPLKAGDVVVLRHNGLEKIKRIHKIDGDKVYVLGDNAGASTDSRNFGWLDQADIIAKVIFPKV